jgi:cyclopropane fatty-acyl-phospholipid synthase-like methyltransferase
MRESAFPRTERYDRAWVLRNSLGENALAQAEELSRSIPFGPDSRVLDLGCGNAITSIFLAREFGAQVWAVDENMSPSENLARIREAGCESRVIPLRANARELPFADDSFDAVVAIDSYYYFGANERFLPYLLRFVRDGGYVGIADVGFAREIPSSREAPEFLRASFAAHWSFVHTIEWWKAQWQKTGLIEVVSAGALPQSRALLLDYARERLASNRMDEIARAAALDTGEWLLLFSMVARKR